MALASLHFARGLQAAVALTSDPQVSVTCYSTKQYRWPHLDSSDYSYLYLRVFKVKFNISPNPGDLIQLPVYQQKQIDQIWTMSHRLSQDFKGHLLQPSV